MPTRYYHTCIVAADPERLAEFYIRVFDCRPTGARHDLGGAPISTGMGLADAHIRGTDVILPGHSDDGPLLEILALNTSTPRPSPVDGQGLMHLAFSVDDVDATLRSLIDAGGSELGAPAQLVVEGVGVATFVYARDPEGNIVEIQRWALTP